MDPLRPTENLLAAHKEIVRIADLRVGRVGHGVEWPDGRGELVQNKVISVVFLLDEPSEQFFILGRHVVHLANGLAVGCGGARFAQHGDTVRKLQPQSFGEEGKVVAWVLFLDRGDLGRELGFETAEDGQEERVEQVEHFVVVLFNGHFQVETDEFSHVAVSVGVFSTEHYHVSLVAI